MFGNGVHVSDLAAQYNMAKSTISTFLKNKEAIRAADVAKGVKIDHSMPRLHIVDEVEKLLFIWSKEKELDGDSIIYEKALRIYADLLKVSHSTRRITKSFYGWGLT